MGIAFAVFSYPTALLPGSLKHSVKSILQDYPRTQNKNVSARCNQCGYSSKSTANLKAHMLVHSGEKPF